MDTITLSKHSMNSEKDILNQLVDQFGLTPVHVNNILTLLDEGNTIPFIARYRKELTGGIDDQVLRDLSDRLNYLRNLAARREAIRCSIAEQDKLSEALDQALDDAKTLVELEDLYRPFKPKRRTRATIAKEKGLEPLGSRLFAQDLTQPLLELAAAFIQPDLGVDSSEAAVQGAMDVVAELLSDDPNLRSLLRTYMQETGLLVTKATDPSAESVYTLYYDFAEALAKLPGHRILAINRGEGEKLLSVKVTVDVEGANALLQRHVLKNNPFTDAWMVAVIADSYERLIAPSLERELRSELTERAEEGAIKVFASNLKPLLLQPPVKDQVVLALDPGFRTGCKLAVIDGTGKVLEVGVIYPTAPANKTEEAKAKLIPLIRNHGVSIIAIGNGTAGRETEAFVAAMLQTIPEKVYYAIVNEAGASVYSASKLGAEEFPEFDVALRSAVSIGRRLQDPLAELVKIDPKSIGVGQYQHDMNQKRLGESLGGVVEDCVNSVGVELNTASPALLSYVSGINGTVAKNILAYREENGRFQSRTELKSVPKLGPKAFQQCAGFLRLADSPNPLDNTGVHPESYPAAKALLAALGFSLKDVGSKGLAGLRSKIQDVDALANTLGIGVPTLLDIVQELEKPGRDPRDEAPPVVLRSDVLSMEDLTQGMVLQGTVRNVIDFGAFVDIGVHQDGLVHLSQLANRYVKHPLDVVRIGDIVSVKVLSVDVAKKRIALTMKGLE